MAKDVPELMRTAAGHYQAGQFAEAAKLYQKALWQMPQNVDALHVRGLAIHQLGQHAQAIELLRQALAVNPKAAQIWFNLGNMLAMTGKISDADAAIEAFEQALELSPQMHHARQNLATILHDLGRTADAINSYRAFLSQIPNHAETWVNLSVALREFGSIGEALEAAKKAVALNPRLKAAHSNLGLLQMQSGDPGSANHSFTTALQLSPSPKAHSNLLLTLLHSDTASPDDIFSEHKKWGEQHANLASPTLPIAREHGDRIRIGYVSNDLRRHPVAAFIEPILRHHDRASVEIFCYSGVTSPDEVTARLQLLSEHWRPIARMNDHALAEQIRSDGIDLLIDLGGHTADHRLLTFALKSAPIAATYLGYPTTTGVPAIDYRITDAHADPPGTTEQFHTEKLIRLPHCFLCYQPPTDAPQVSDLPADTNSHITFGSFNHAGKISPTTIGLWASAMHAVPDSRLLLKALALMHAPTRDRLLGELEQHAIARDRITVLPAEQSAAAHLQRYEQMDIALDTFPYHGTTTTCEALWMGVPVITLAGKTHVSRVGVSLLSNVGLPELVAENADQFPRIAARLAIDLTRLRELRKTMRKRMQSSPLLDGVTFTRELENAYREMIALPRRQ